MVCHERITERKNIDEPQRRKKHYHKITSSDQHCPRPRPCVAFDPEQSAAQNRNRQRQILQWPRSIDGPSWINKRQWIRPAQFPEIKPKRVPGDDEFLP